MIETARAYLIPRFPFDGSGFNREFKLWDMVRTMTYSVALGVLGAYGSLNVKCAPFKAHRINVAYGCLLGGVIVYPLIAGISAFAAHFFKRKDSDQTVPSPTDQAIKDIEKASSESLGKSILENIDTFAKKHVISLEETTSLKNTVQAAIDSQVSQLAEEVKKVCINDDLKRAIEEVVKTQLSSHSDEIRAEISKLVTLEDDLKKLRTSNQEFIGYARALEEVLVQLLKNRQLNFESSTEVDNPLLVREITKIKEALNKSEKESSEPFKIERLKELMQLYMQIEVGLFKRAFPTIADTSIVTFDDCVKLFNDTIK